MFDTISEVLDAVIDLAVTDLDCSPQDVENLLAEYGFMVVPIEDPTNLGLEFDE